MSKQNHAGLAILDLSLECPNQTSFSLFRRDRPYTGRLVTIARNLFASIGKEEQFVDYYPVPTG